MVDPLLSAIGARVRSLRRKRGWTIAQLAKYSGLSLRFVGQLERGHANISVVRLARVAEALDVRLVSLIDPDAGQKRRASWVALLGVRGAGKSTVGVELAKRLSVPFVELDRRIEDEAGLSLTEMFSLHGEGYYRDVECRVLARLLEGPEYGVLATGGSLVTHPESWSLLRDRAQTVWLKAEPKDHWNRVLAQGDDRPMRASSNAFEQLQALLAARAPLYREADITINTSERRPEEIVDRIAAVVGRPLLR